MFMRDGDSDDLIRIDDIERLLNPFQDTVQGRSQAGEEEQEEVRYQKGLLRFPSGESIPRCWIDPEYQK